MRNIPERYSENGVREFECIFCHRWTIDDKGNVDITQNGKIICCWACWEDRPHEYWKWYIRKIVMWQKEHIPYKFHTPLWRLYQFICKDHLWRYA